MTIWTNCSRKAGFGRLAPPTRRFRYYRLRSGALRKTKRMLHSLVRIRDLATGVGDVGNTV